MLKSENKRHYIKKIVKRIFFIFLQIFLYFAKSQIRLQPLEIFIIETKHLPQNRFCPYAPRFSPESSAQKLSPFGAAIYAPALTSS